MNMAGLYREGKQKESSPASQLGKFKMGVCQPYPIACRNWGMLREPGDRGHFQMSIGTSFSHLY